MIRAYGVALMCAAALMAAPRSGALQLATNGAADYVIVTSADAIPAETTAANELKAHLDAVTGAEFVIQREAEVAPETKRIVVGPGEFFRAAFPEVDLSALGHDGVFIRTRGDALYLAGGRPRGTLYAVYTFLEDTVGVRWWTKDAAHIPDKPTLDVPPMDHVYKPALLYREAFYRDAFDPVFSARTKCNGHHNRPGEEHGGHYTILGWCHTFHRLLPPEQYFGEHPEWYSLVNGERVHHRAQLCLTNGEMRAELTRNALKWIAENPEAGMISISQNDCNNPCQCAKCSALAGKEGAQSGPLLHFVNAVAEDIEKEYPGFFVMTLAYHYTRQAPKHVRPRGNVVIRLCSIECSFAQPLATGPQNADFQRDMAAWSAIAPRLYVWDYVTNFHNYIMPHPNFRVLAPNIRYFTGNNTIGLFEQGDSQCSCSSFPELRTWLLAHLMWDPSRDPNVLLGEFLEGYYGPAAGPLRAYIELVCDAVENTGTYLRCGMSSTEAWLPPETLVQATKLFDNAAEAVAGNAELARRADRARMPIDHVWIRRYHGMKQFSEESGAYAGPEDLEAFVDRFIERAHAYNVGNYREGRPFPQLEARLEAVSRPAGPPPPGCEDLAEKHWRLAEEPEFSLHRQGSMSFLVDDPEAANGGAAKMTTNHTEWAVQWPVGSAVAAMGPVHCYARVRCGKKAGAPADALAGRVGIYDQGERRSLTAKPLLASEVAGPGYHTVDLGVHELSPRAYVWAAPAGNPDQVTGLYVDRFWFIRKNR